MGSMNAQNINTLIVLSSHHHKNTEKIAAVMAEVLNARIKTPQQVAIEELQDYRLIGFGSGIYSDKHHPLILDLADRLPSVSNRKAFIFSTCGAPAVSFGEEYRQQTIDKNHIPLREKLKSKGFEIVGEFSCRGYNTNNFLKFVGGINKGKPDAGDLKDAGDFAKNLREKYLRANIS
jgi:flavodoxin